MKWSEVLALIGEEPLFESAQLMAGRDSPAQIHRQLCRWEASGRVIQLRRGLYALAPPYARVTPHPLAIASRLQRPSYVSLESALAHHGLIPEAVPAVTSVTTGRPARIDTPLGTFLYRHIQVPLFRGYGHLPLAPRQSCFMARPAKALLDLFYLKPGRVGAAFIEELRLAANESLDPARLEELAEEIGKPKLIVAARLAAEWLRSRQRDERLRPSWRPPRREGGPDQP